jgi:4-fold beta flower protein
VNELECKKFPRKELVIVLSRLFLRHGMRREILLFLYNFSGRPLNGFLILCQLRLAGRKTTQTRQFGGSMNRLWITFTTLILFFGLALSQEASAREISLYDQEGEAVAYIDTNSDATIYLWSGEPVAYLNGEDVYGFNGKHLGWFEEGIIWDHNGDGVGFIKGAVNKLTKLEALKGLKKLMPLKSLRELAPLKPLKSERWSRIPLDLCLLSGAK